MWYTCTFANDGVWHTPVQGLINIQLQLRTSRLLRQALVCILLQSSYLNPDEKSQTQKIEIIPISQSHS